MATEFDVIFLGYQPCQVSTLIAVLIAQEDYIKLLSVCSFHTQKYSCNTQKLISVPNLISCTEQRWGLWLKTKLILAIFKLQIVIIMSC